MEPKVKVLYYIAAGYNSKWKARLLCCGDFTSMRL